ncbi:MAG: T9SS type A sorting domain-containing protein, partial [Candidatus Hydrothermia bacterium]
SPLLAAQRSVVVEEFSTWTCPYCPYAIKAVDSLKKVFGDTVTVMTYISSMCGTAQVRFNYYSIYYVPTCWFDGLAADTGGYAGNFNDYRAHVNARKGIPAPLRIENINARLVNDSVLVDCDVVLEQNITSGNSPRLFGLITERNIQANQDGTRADYFTRTMFSPTSGTNLTVFNAGEQQHFHLGYKMTASDTWNRDSLDLAIWVQYYNTKEVLQGAQVHFINPGVSEGTVFAPGFDLFSRGNRLFFSLPDATDLTLSLYDVTGRQVAMLASGNFSTGTHEVSLPLLKSGVYTAIMVSDRGTKTLNIVK